MKKILFVVHGMGIGGIEKCLINLINAMSEKEYSIDLLLMNDEIELMDCIKRNVKVLESHQYIMNTTDTINHIKKQGGIRKNFKQFIKYCSFRLKNKYKISAWKTFRSIPKRYDIAIAYSQNDYSPYYVIDKVLANRKVMWYHNGAYEMNHKKYRYDKKYYSRFDYLVAVSSDCKKVLQKYFNLDDKKVIVLRNICDEEMIYKEADAYIPNSYQKEGAHLVTVGRLTREKGADIVLKACKFLKNKGINFCWHWVGDGNLRNEIYKSIICEKLEDCFILEGNQNNPYPFMKHADVYIQPSYYEAYSTTVTEAKVLNKAIIVTDVGGMRDLINDGINGMIVPIDFEEIGKAIIELLKNDVLVDKFRNNLIAEELDMEKSMQGYKKTVFRD